MKEWGFPILRAFDYTKTYWEPETWGVLEISLVMAYEQYLSELCQTCGTPYWLGHIDEGNYVVKTDVVQCLVCKGREERVNRMTDNGKKPLPNHIHVLADASPIPEKDAPMMLRRSEALALIAAKEKKARRITADDLLPPIKDDKKGT